MGMLQASVDQRYTAAQVLDHPWVNVSVWTELIVRISFYSVVELMDSLDVPG